MSCLLLRGVLATFWSGTKENSPIRLLPVTPPPTSILLLSSLTDLAVFEGQKREINWVQGRKHTPMENPGQSALMHPSYDASLI